jgi:hypothetical protein
MFQKELYNGIPNITVRRVLRKRLHFIQHLEQWIVCMPLSVNVFVTLTTQQHLEYHCKALLNTLYNMTNVLMKISDICKICLM